MNTTASPTRKAPQYKTPEAELRAKVHNLSRQLGLCEQARRNILWSLSSSRYARDLNLAELTVVVAWLESRLEQHDARTRHISEFASDEMALEVLA